MNALVSTLKHALVAGGAGWVMVLLLLLSVVSIGIIVERLVYYRSLQADVAVLGEALHVHLQQADYQAAERVLESSSSVAAHIARAGLRVGKLGPGAADKAMASAGALWRSRLEHRLAVLGTLGNNAPFVGLFGTVIGIILAFEELGHGAPGHLGTSSSALASSAIMSSIAEALVATAVGLLVALPAVAAYNYLQRRVAGILSESEVLSNLVLAYLSGHTRRRADDGPPTPLSASASEAPLAPKLV